MIPILTGNLGVDWLMRAWAGRGTLRPVAAEAELDEWQALGVDGVEEYLAWGASERSEGAWDLGQVLADREAARTRGLRWLLYPWVHVVPPWARDRHAVVGYRCLEHGEECGWPSIFAAGTLALYDHVYAALRRELGDEPDGLCVALPADYGEVAYPTGWGNWVAPLAPPRDHLHTGFWAGDAEARAAWRRAVADPPGGHREGFGWQPGSTDAERDLFASFYLGAMADFVDRALEVVRGHFPTTPLTVKVGHGGESLAYGIDPTRLAEVASRHGAALRSTQSSLPQLHHKRLEAPCRHFGVELGSEPPVDIGRETTMLRLFCDASAGVRHFFDYPEHLEGARDLMARYRGLLRGEAAQTDVGVLFATRDLWRHPDWGFPPVLHDLAEELRDRFDHAVLDEALCRRGALDSLRVLALCEGAGMEEEAQLAILDWVRAGGWLVSAPEVDGEGPLYEALRAVPAADEALRLRGTPAPCVSVDFGGAVDRLRLWGDWFPPEDAAQFRATPPRGDGCRWTGARASLPLPVDPGVRHLLEIECWVHPRSVERRHEVWIEGHCLGPVQRAGLQRWAKWVEPAVLEGRDVIELRFDSEVFRAEELIGRGDDRELGLAVLWVRLTREGAPVHERVLGARSLRAEWARDLEEPECSGAVGRGRILRSARRPALRFVALLEEAARRRSRAQSEWFACEDRPEGLRAAIFEQRVLLWNRSEKARVVAWPGARPPRVEVPAGELAEIRRGPASPTTEARG